METDNIIGMRLAATRKKQGLSKATLAQMTGFGASRLGNWEAGIRIPKPDSAKILGEILGVSPEYLLGLTDTEQRADPVKAIPLWTISEIASASSSLSLCLIKPENSLPLPTCCEPLLQEAPFALRLDDDSMAPHYNKGNILVFLQKKTAYA